ncbi:Uncharacterised protein [Mycobacterium tuberculosis]|nr:Uncharacterised protein [Mycobacterium tuberculosis]
MTSPICPSPPPLITAPNDDSVCSVDGYADERLNGMVAPGASRPLPC